MSNRRVRSKIELTLSKDQSLGEIREREMKSRLQLEETQSRLDELTGQVKEAEKSRRQLNAEIERKEAEIRNQKSQLRETENNLKREQENNQRLKRVIFLLEKKRNNCTGFLKLKIRQNKKETRRLSTWKMQHKNK